MLIKCFFLLYIHFVLCSEIQSLDSVVQECEAVLESTRKSLLTMPFGAFERVRAWRAKRRDTKAAESIDLLMPKIRVAELSLRYRVLHETIINVRLIIIFRATIGDVVEKKSAIRDQAKHLVARLRSCVYYNDTCLDAQKDVVEETRLIVNQLSSASAQVKGMVSFNSEILRYKEHK